MKLIHKIRTTYGSLQPLNGLIRLSINILNTDMAPKLTKFCNTCQSEKSYKLKLKCK